MDYERVLCLCPAGRFFLVGLTLSTWTSVRTFILTENTNIDLARFDAVIVMDRFVTPALVERFAVELPVIILAWNGMFEIYRYRDQCRTDVTYMGTDASAKPEMVAAGIPYLPMINAHCRFSEWQDRYYDKAQFTVLGSVSYRLRWLRTRAYSNRGLCVALSAGAAIVKRPRSVGAIVKSAFMTDKLTWAGNCYYDLESLGLSLEERADIDTSVDAMKRASTPTNRLDAGLSLVEKWRSIAGGLEPARAHEGIYVANTLVRWAVLEFLRAVSVTDTWFFGADNVGLGLPYELDVYSLVSNHRVAFVDFGGKTSETTLYPRSLQLLARSCYVIAISALAADQDQVAETVERIHQALRDHPSNFFAELEARRAALYASLPADCELGAVQARVWNDFAAIEAAV